MKKENFQKNFDWVNSKLFPGIEIRKDREGAGSDGMWFSKEAMELPHKQFKLVYEDGRGKYFV